MTDLERKNLRRAMYSREAVRTEEDEEGERSRENKCTLLMTEAKSHFLCAVVCNSTLNFMFQLLQCLHTRPFWFSLQTFSGTGCDTTFSQTLNLILYCVCVCLLVNVRLW